MRTINAPLEAQRHEEKEKLLEIEEAEKKLDEAEEESSEEIKTVEEVEQKKLQKGDWMIQVHVIEARDLKARGSGGTNDPIVQVKCMEKKLVTEPQKKTQNPIFDETLSFIHKNLEPEDVNQGTVLLSVFDHNKLMKNQMIGAFEFDLPSIYYRPSHEYYRQWVALADVSGKHEGIQGYLLVSIQVMGPNDEPNIRRESDVVGVDLGGEMNPLMPPQIESKPFCLSVIIHRMKNLPRMDGTLARGRCDPYVRVKFAGRSIRSRIINREQDPVFDEKLQIPVYEPVMGSNISITAWDHDKTSKNDLIGSVVLKYKQAKKGYETHWVHMYGAPIGKQGGDARLMNKGIEEGTTYRGSILLSCNVTEVDEPVKVKKEKIEWPLQKEDMPREVRWALQVDVYQATEVSMNKGKLRLEVHVGHRKFKTTNCTALQNMVEWTEILTDEKGGQGAKRDYIILKMLENPEQCCDVLFYLVSEKDKRISWYRKKWVDIINKGWNAEPGWLTMNEESTVVTLREDEFPGNLLVGIRGGPLEHHKFNGKQWVGMPKLVSPRSRPFLHLASGGDDNYFASETLRSTIGGYASDQSPTLHSTIHGYNDTASVYSERSTYAPTRSEVSRFEHRDTDRSDCACKITTGELRIKILSGSNLPHELGEDGKASVNPYVTITAQQGSNQKKTKVLKKTANPQWGEQFIWKSLSMHDTISIKMYHKGMISKKLIGNVDRIAIAQYTNRFEPQQKQFFMNSKEHPKFKLEVEIEWRFHTSKTRVVRRKRNKKQGRRFLRNVHEKPDELSNVAELGRPFPVQRQMKVYVYQARDLSPKDDNGLSDPYVSVQYCGVKIRTKTVKKNCNPQWLETLSDSVMVPHPKEFAPSIRIMVFDEDFLSKDDLIGSIAIPYLDALKMTKKQWFPLNDRHGEPGQGEVYLGFEFLDPDQKNYTTKFNMNTNFKTFYLRLMTLGVRDLRSAIPMMKTQISYATNEGKVFKTKKSSKPSTKNANFVQVHKMALQIPDDIEMAPTLSVVVNDLMFGSLLTRLIGTSTLKLRHLMEPTGSIGWVIKETGDLDIVEDDKDIQREKDAEELAERSEMRDFDRDCFNLAQRKVEIDLDAKLFGLETAKKLRKYAEFKRGGVYFDDFAADKDVEVELDAKSDQQSFVQGDNTGDSYMVGGGNSGEVELQTFAVEPEQKAKLTSDQIIVDTEFYNPDKSKRMLDPAIEEEKVGEGIEDYTEDVIFMGTSLEDEKAPLLGDVDGGDEGEVQERTCCGFPLSGAPMGRSFTRKKRLPPTVLRFDINEDRVQSSEKEHEWLVRREKLTCELEEWMEENEKNVDPFNCLDLMMGQSGSSFFKKRRRKVGTLKGLWKLTSESGDSVFGSDMKPLIMGEKVEIRVYILTCDIAIGTDSDNKSDPYLVVKCGDKSYSTRDNHFSDTLYARFHEFFSFRYRLPGPSQLRIQVWDWDGIGDDLIGETTIDIENRWFSRDWRRLTHKPLERRSLKNPTSDQDFGQLEMWVDIVKQSQVARNPAIDIGLPPARLFEMRIIVWDAKDVVSYDEITDQNDLKVKVKLVLPGQKFREKETDLHFRAKGGRGCWHWRIKFSNIALPVSDWRKEMALTISMWDADFFSANDQIGEARIPIKEYLKRVMKNPDPDRLVMVQKDSTDIWLAMRNSNPKENKGKLDFLMRDKDPRVQGMLRISLEVLPQELADELVAGEGRADPNANPFLPPPEGRFELSMNPFSIVRQLLGDKLCAKICMLICCVFCISFCVMLAPSLSGSLMSGWMVV